MYHRRSRHLSSHLKLDNIRNEGDSPLSERQAKLSSRAGHLPTSLLWMDSKGNRLPIKYVYDTTYPMDAATTQHFEAQVKRWSDKTCLKFQEVPTPKKNMTENDYNWWCYNTNVKRKEDKLLSLSYNGGGGTPLGIKATGVKCNFFNYLKPTDDNQWNNYLLFTWPLGLMTQLNLPDVDKYIRFNFEHFGNPTDRRHFNGIQKCKGKALALPIPFDYLSVTIMGSSFSGVIEEATPVYVTMDPSQQYLLDYRQIGQLPASYFDVLTINMMYKCIPTWESSCKASGKEVPKCKNYGYVTKDCTCLCAPSYSGKTCEKRTGDNVPYPTQEGAFSISIIDDKNYDLGDLLPLKTASLPEAGYALKYTVFINVKIQPKRPERLPTIKVFFPFKKYDKYFDAGMQDFIISAIHQVDCEQGVRLLWGNSKMDGRRLACECLSSLVRNELAVNSRVIRGREPDMTVTLINGLGAAYRDPGVSVDTSKFILMTEFLQSPKSIKPNTTSTENPGTGDGVGPGPDPGTNTGSGNSSEPVVSATAAAMTATGGSGAVTAAAAAGAGLALLLLLCLLLFCLKRRKKKEKELEEDEEEDENSESASESDDEN